MKFHHSILIFILILFIFKSYGKIRDFRYEKKKSIWVEGPPSPCSVTCGKGLEFREYVCKNPYTQAMENDCDLNRKPQPVARQCDMGNCLPLWVVGSWSECTKSCGKGFKMRKVNCALRGINGTYSFLDDNYCIPMKPHNTITCSERKCPDWTVGDWSKCSVTCGNGTNYRTVECLNNSCDLDAKPAVTKACFGDPCGKIEKNMWDYEEFSIKIDDLDDTKQFITSEDYNNIFRKHFKETDDENLNRNIKYENDPLQDSKYDDTKIKNYRYFQKDSSDNGLISIVIADDQTIVYLLTNSSLNLICRNNDKKNLSWYHDDIVISKEETLTLNKVSIRESGLYICRRNNLSSKVAVVVVHEIAEEIMHKPTTILDPIENYKIEPAFNFSLQYSTNYKLRFSSSNLHSSTFFDQEIVCTVDTNRFLMILDDSLCEFDEFTAKDLTKVIYEWKKSPWSECSQDCVENGLGKKTREVWCQTVTGLKVHDDFCSYNVSKKLPTEILCPRKACEPHWKAGSFGECVGDCGKYGIASREVVCIRGVGEVLDKTNCKQSEKPPEIAPCYLFCEKNVECVDEYECKLIDPVERCTDENIKHCCQTCSLP